MGAVSSVLPFSSFWNSYRPFDALPDELLVLIFEHVGKLLIGRPPIACLRVSKRWRAIAQTTPRLWSSISLYGQHPLRGLESLIALSLSAPLNLDLDVAGDATYPGTACHPWRAVQVANVVAENMHRVARLQLRFHPHQASLFDNVLSSTAPILDEVVLMCGGVVDLDLDAPGLRRLEVDRMQLRQWDLSAFPLLSELCLRSVDLELPELHSIISSLQRLETLVLDEGSVQASWDGLAHSVTADWSHAFLRRLVITNAFGGSVLGLFLLKLPLADLEHFELTFDPFTEYTSTMSSVVDTLFIVLKPTSIRVWRTKDKDKIWHVQLDDPRRSIAFPQRVGGPIISTVLEAAARSVRKIFADDAFCNQIVRRHAKDALPEFQYFEELEFIRDAKGRLPSRANEALEACLEVSQRD
ncbi:hypothetical protein EXIGLDRAFT_777129 [Exidia glandulosa HHB12029]|uniref:F-box domain-containing protein n=1 Tax=Exidia glandulosa HHB12029 TaxID=1314781 RepID=A0A165D6D0_EXIGL|nr:hypothetical protein EXIGLDRAFT_777129 [Exidia glandulosa HHB12029]